MCWLLSSCMLTVLCFSKLQTGFQTIAIDMKGRQAILSGRDPIYAKFTTDRWESIRICCRRTPLPVLRSVALHSVPALSVCREAQAMSIRTCNQQEVQDRAPKVAKTDAITTLRVKRLTENAVVPTRGSSKAAGYDLSRSAEGQRFLGQPLKSFRSLTTGLPAVPMNTLFLLRARSL